MCFKKRHWTKPRWVNETMVITDPFSGNVRRAKIFVAVTASGAASQAGASDDRPASDGKFHASFWAAAVYARILAAAGIKSEHHVRRGFRHA